MRWKDNHIWFVDKHLEEDSHGLFECISTPLPFQKNKKLCDKPVRTGDQGYAYMKQALTVQEKAFKMQT